MALTYFGKPAAVACIRADGEDSRLCGNVSFYPQCDGVLVAAQVWGLPGSATGFYGLHIHQGDSCTGSGFPRTGSHYDPAGREHPLHAGDLPPLMDCGGKAFLAVKTNRFTLEEVVGRTVVIHAMGDDFTTQPAGNAGSKIGCGVIRKG